MFGWKDTVSPWMLVVQREGHRRWDGGGGQASTGAPWEEARPLAHIKRTHTAPGCPTPVKAYVYLTSHVLVSRETGLQRCKYFNILKTDFTTLSRVLRLESDSRWMHRSITSFAIWIWRGSSFFSAGPSMSSSEADAGGGTSGQVMTIKLENRIGHFMSP